jgi:hypothetical protein
MALVDRTTVNGIDFPLKFNTYWSTEDGEPKGEPITTIELSDIGFQSQLEENFFSAPEGAKLLEGL